MQHHSVSRLAALGVGTLVAAIAACSSSSTAASTKVDLTGTYGIKTFNFAGAPQTIDGSDSAILTCTKTKYHVVGTGNLALFVQNDSGTYTATDTATVNGAVYGTFTQQSLVNGTGATGSFSLSADKNTLTETVTTQAGVVASTWVRGG